MENDEKSHPEQLRYAAVLHWSALAGFLTMVVTYATYVLGWLPSQVPLQRLPQLWSLSAPEYLRATGTPKGWSWLLSMNEGDSASHLGIAILSACSIVCVLSIVPIYAKRKQTAYVVICLLEVAMLLVSAAGIIHRH